MPSVDKALRREHQRRKARQGKWQNVRYRSLRAGESLAAFEADRKTTLQGKAPRRAGRKKRSR